MIVGTVSYGFLFSFPSLSWCSHLHLYRNSATRSNMFNNSRDSREDGCVPTTSKKPFKMSSLRHRPSTAMFKRQDSGQTTSQSEELEPLEPNRPLSRQVTAPDDKVPRISKKAAMQDFFKTTGASLKSTGSVLRASSARYTGRLPERSKVAKQPLSRRNSQLRSFDLSDDVIERLMGPPKPPDGVHGKIQSDEFLLKMRIRASSRSAAAERSPISAISRTEPDRTPLSREDLEQMLVGAPHFNVQQMENKSGLVYRPQVIFRGGNTEEAARFGMDYRSLGNKTFEASTLGLHRTKETTAGASSDLPVPGQLHEHSRGAGLLEVPNMLSANGLDPGTIGFEHFLQLPIADSLASPPSDTDYSAKRALLLSAPAELGLRTISNELIVNRLAELGELHASQHHQATPWTKDKIQEMGEDLFAQVLAPELGPSREHPEIVTMATQITALQTLLMQDDLWYDFSLVEWRIRVGQVLWASEEPESEDDEDFVKLPRDRDVLLLQILLATELLVRLDALKSLPTLASGFPPVPPLISETERDSIASRTTRKVDWDLQLATVFVENLDISADGTAPSDEGTRIDKRSSVFSVFSFLTARESNEDGGADGIQPVFRPKREALQLSGLLYFAQAIEWPHVDVVQAELEAKLMPAGEPQLGKASQVTLARPRSIFIGDRPVSGVSVYATPLSSPSFPTHSVPSNRSSYFGGLVDSQPQKKRPAMSRMATAQSMQLLPARPTSADSSSFEVGGWLSRSFLTGLVLPGEPASHFLIGTLLENSPEVIGALGDCADLYGGFIYGDRSYWSKSCIVGRVLAATEGATECMGWVSVPGASHGHADGWIEIDVKIPPVPQSARIKSEGVVHKASDPIHGTQAADLRVDDFTTPRDGLPVMGNEAKFDGIQYRPLQATAVHKEGDLEDSPTSSTPVLTFSSPLNLKIAALEVPLTHDIHFVSSYPCHPSPAPPSPRITRSPSGQSPAIEQTSALAVHVKDFQAFDSARPSESPSSRSPSVDKDLPTPPAHALHVKYRYEVLPVASLLAIAPQSRPRALSKPMEFTPGDGTVVPSDEDAEIAVLDCRGSADLELLARAYCAMVGENALIGKTGRTCLACCVREASSLGINVVIRT